MLDMATEFRFALIETAAHVGVLGPLAREHEHRASTGLDSRSDINCALAAIELRDRRFTINGYERQSLIESAPSHLQGMGNVRQLDRGMCVQVHFKIFSRRAERRGAARRQQDQLRCCGRTVDAPGAGRLFHDNMRVGTADAEGAHSGTTRTRRPGPRHKFVVDEERRRREIDQRVGSPVVHGRRQHLMLKSQRGLDHAGNPGRCIQVTDIALHRSQCTELQVIGGRAECLGEARHLDRIAHGRCGTMAFHIGNGSGIDTCRG